MWLFQLRPVPCCRRRHGIRALLKECLLWSGRGREGVTDWEDKKIRERCVMPTSRSWRIILTFFTTERYRPLTMATIVGALLGVSGLSPCRSTVVSGVRGMFEKGRHH